MSVKLLMLGLAPEKIEAAFPAIDEVVGAVLYISESKQGTRLSGDIPVEALQDGLVGVWTINRRLDGFRRGTRVDGPAAGRGARPRRHLVALRSLTDEQVDHLFTLEEQDMIRIFRRLIKGTGEDER